MDPYLIVQDLALHGIGSLSFRAPRIDRMTKGNTLSLYIEK